MSYPASAARLIFAWGDTDKLFEGGGEMMYSLKADCRGYLGYIHVRVLKKLLRLIYADIP